MARSMKGLQVLLVILPIVTASCGWNTHAPGFTKEKFSKIKVGMTEAQVRKILGKPMRALRTEDRLYRVKVASGSEVEQIISYDERGAVAEAHGYVAEKRHLCPGISRVQAEGILHCSVSKRIGVRHRWVYAHNPPLPFAGLPNAEVEFGYDRRVEEIVKD